MRRSWNLLFVLLVTTSICLSSAELDAADTSGRRATLDIVAVDPDLLLPVDHKTVLQVTVQYKIDQFEKGKFFLFPQYRVSDTRSTSGRLKSKELIYLEAESGRVVLECDLSFLESNTDVERPLKLDILLLEEGSDKKGRPIAASQTIVILTK